MPTPFAFCDAAEVVRIESELAKDPTNIGVGIIDNQSGRVRLFTFDETDAYSRANPLLLLSAGHEAATAMAGLAPDRARGFVLAKQGGRWQVLNRSHLNQPDSQTNPMQMDPALFAEVVAAMTGAGVHNPVIV